MQGKRILWGLTGQTLAEVVNKVVPLVILHFVVERVGQEAFGYAQFGMTLVDLAIPFVVLGYGQLASVDIGGARENPATISKIISETIYLRLIGAIAATILLLSFVYLTPAYREYLPVVAAISFVLFTSAIEMHFVHVGSARMVSLSAFTIVLKIATLGAILLFVNSPDDAIMYAVFTFGANALIAVATFVYNVKRYPLVRPDVDALKKRFFSSLPFALFYFWSVAWLSFDLIVAEYGFGKAGAAIYGANLRMVAAAINLLNAVCLVFFSEVIGAKSREELSKLVNVSFLFVFMASLPIAVGGWFSSTDFIRLILNEDYLADYQVFHWLFSGVVAQGVLIILGFHLLLFLRKASLQNIFMGSAITVSVLLALAGSAHDGLAGIAMGSFTGRTLAAIVLIIIARRYLDSFWYQEWIKVVVAAAVMGLALWPLQDRGLVWKILVGALTYGLTIAVLFRAKFLHYWQLVKGKKH